MNVTKLLTAWPIKGPCQTSPLRRGMNNRVWRVEAADGQIYVLRVLPDELALPRVRYETALLHALSEKQLPFRLPLPLKANSGDIIVPFEPETGKNTIATLQAFLPGSTPDRHDSIKAAQAGEALAVLDTALATLPELHAPEQPQLFSSFADLTHCHPLVPDPLIAIERLPIERDLSRRIRAYLSTVMARWDDLHNRLPQQLLHRDYDPSNILMDASGVTAVLDFEFARFPFKRSRTEGYPRCVAVTRCYVASAPDRALPGGPGKRCGDSEQVGGNTLARKMALS